MGGLETRTNSAPGEANSPLSTVYPFSQVIARRNLTRQESADMPA